MLNGRNLQKVVVALRADTAYFIQEFNPRKRKKPTDQDALFIESVEVLHDAHVDKHDE